MRAYRGVPLVLVGAACIGCATISSALNPPPAPTGWQRLEFDVSTSVCTNYRCRLTLDGGLVPLRVAARSADYDRHEVPGWPEISKANRAGSAITGAIARKSLGVTTMATKYYIGAVSVTEAGDGAFQMRCSTFWVADEETAHTRAEGDHVARATRKVQGLNCRSTTLADTTAVRWRISAGITPTIDSLAATYDTAAAHGGVLISASPVVSFERTSAAQAPATGPADTTQYRLERQSTAPGIFGEVSRLIRGQTPIAVIRKWHGKLLMDIAPEADSEELRMTQLLAGLIVSGHID